MRIWGSGLLNGLRISMRNLRRGPITVQYPFEKLELPERARWTVAPLYDEEGVAKCTACMTCVKTCPDHILALDVTTNEDRSKHIDRFSYQIGGCMMCGLCVESCPFAAITMSHDYELAVLDVKDLEYDLLTDTPAYKPKKKSPAPAAAPAPPAAPESAPADSAPEPATGTENNEGSDGS